MCVCLVVVVLLYRCSDVGGRQDGKHEGLQRGHQQLDQVHEGSKQSMAVYHQAQKLIFWVLGGLFVVLLALRHTLLGMFGEEYLAANQALTLLCGAYAVWGLAAFSSTWLQYVKRGRNVVWIGLTGIGLDAALNLVLIPRYGIDGAAAATLLTLFSCSVAIWLYQHHTFKVMTRDQNYQQA